MKRTMARNGSGPVRTYRKLLLNRKAEFLVALGINFNWLAKSGQDSDADPFHSRPPEKRGGVPSRNRRTRLSGDVRRDAPEVARELSEAADQIRESKLKEKIAEDILILQKEGQF